MPPRKSHLKSRNGCESCEKRRVKCNEKHPSCSNCTFREVPCSFQSTTIATPPIRCDSTSSDLTGRSPSIPDVVSNRSIELASMHQWSTSTSMSLCRVSSDVHLWQKEAVKVAFKHEFLLNGILALAALDIAFGSSSNVSQSELFRSAALSYYSAASTAFQSIEVLTEESCLASLLFSPLANVVNLVLPRCYPLDNPKHSMLTSILQTFTLFHGCCNMTEPNLQWLLDSPISIPTELDKDPRWYLNADATMAIARLRAINKQMTSAISKLPRIPNEEPHDEEMYEVAIQHLELCFARESEGSIQFFYLGWPEMCTKPFLEAMIDSKIMALVLLMHWGVLLDRSKAWWVGSSGRDLVRELYDMLVPMNGSIKEWKEAIEWASGKVKDDTEAVKI